MPRRFRSRQRVVQDRLDPRLLPAGGRRQRLRAHPRRGARPVGDVDRVDAALACSSCARSISASRVGAARGIELDRDHELLGASRRRARDFCLGGGDRRRRLARRAHVAAGRSHLRGARGVAHPHRARAWRGCARASCRSSRRRRRSRPRGSGARARRPSTRASRGRRSARRRWPARRRSASPRASPCARRRPSAGACRAWPAGPGCSSRPRAVRRAPPARAPRPRASRRRSCCPPR